MNLESKPKVILLYTYFQPDVVGELAALKKAIKMLNQSPKNDQNFKFQLITRPSAKKHYHYKIAVAVYSRKWKSPEFFLNPEEMFESQEFDEIFVYRKINKAKLSLKDNAVLEYASVIKFFNQVNNNKNIISRTYTSNLQKVIHTDLTNINLPRSDQKHIFPRAIDKEKTNMDSWWENSPLRFNPFTPEIDEKLEIETYTIASWQNPNDPQRLTSKTKLIYIFGDKGTGKTTLLENTLRTITRETFYQTSSNEEKVFCLRITPHDFNVQLDNIEGVESYTSNHFIQLIFELITEKIISLAQRKIPKPEINIEKSFEALTKLMSWVNQQKYSTILCLLDGLDEIEQIKRLPRNEKLLINLIKSIVPLASESFRIRLFLTNNIERIIRKENSFFRLDQFPPIYLQWDKDKLINMINRRMQLASRNGSDLLFRELNPDTAKIEEEMAALAENNPRAMLWLCNRVIETHIQQSSPQEYIKPETWILVKRDWQNKKIDFQQSTNNFWIDFDLTPYFNTTELRLSKTLSSLLRCLINANGGICSPETLIKSAYPPDEDPKYLMKTFYQQMGNLAKEVNIVAPGWLQNIRGKGYRLMMPNNYGRNDYENKNY